MRRTKLVCTIGPASSAPKTIRGLVTLVDVFRINFSHGDRASHLRDIVTIRGEARRAGRTVAILQDLPGPKIRIGKMAGGSAELTRGSNFMLTDSDVLGDSARASVNYPRLLDSVEKGDLLHLADGLIRLRVDGRTEDGIQCTVLAGGTLSSGKGVNAPGVRMRVEYPTAADSAHLKFGLEQGVDFVAASFVRTRADLRSLRRMMPKDSPMLIAKIEKREAVRNFDEILAEADGIMVARGDLGIEVPIETVPAIQKRIVGKCNLVAKPVIVATQMLVSMVNFPVPTRAEVTDVAAAVQEGTDAVMLSDETAVGKYPVEAARMLDRISKSAEKMPLEASVTPKESTTGETPEAIGRAACGLADYVGAKAIVAPTQTGSTAKRVAMYRPRQPIVALCTEGRVARQLKLYRGVIPVVVKQAKTTDWLFARADQAAERLGFAKKGDRIVVTSGTPGMRGTTNLIKVSVVGSKA
ncbi:MAG TPA: pyruvate kinase [Nitrososphaerales archaeon]|nr:pyruvate kinase [Nitrososphaerales archaeon]